ncbi:MAG: CinA family protein [Sphingomonadales bacterium CG12_big_fil_rev_8_21_14_0_65_65_10]|nr:MAG: CinA family protein [Sphingomonadales bacterium CG12_big_fil_rev_8_21_14_0_65_65_10]
MRNTRSTETEPSDFRSILSPRVRGLARTVLEEADKKDLRIATAESCTGGLLSTLLTDLPGVSHCFECGFVVYSDEAKERLLGIPEALIKTHGAVSRPIAIEMAVRALERSGADLSLSITGFAGSAPSSEDEGLVHIALAGASSKIEHKECRFGTVGRDVVRSQALQSALELLEHTIGVR